MAMSVGGGGEDEPMMEINTTPLIDVMLVLLIMFIITLPVMTHAVKLDMPQSRNTPPPPVVIEPIRLDIDWDGTDHLERHAGAARTRWKATSASKRPRIRSPKLHVRPDRRANYDTVAKVLALAQRNGMQRIGFVGNEQFME